LRRTVDLRRHQGRRDDDKERVMTERAMTDRDRYIPGVPCWVDSVHPDPAAAAEFYSRLFGWTCDDRMPADVPGHYYMATIGGRDAAAIGSVPEGAPPVALWNTYVWVDSADETTAKAVSSGATIIVEPLDVFDAGRMAMFADPEGAAIAVWQPNRHRGALAVNEHGGVNFNDLHTRDLDRAEEFYGAVFGWETLELGPGASMWALPAYGDFLEELNPGMRAQMAAMGAPTGFENVVASVVPIGPDDAATPAHWGITFAVDDADAAARTATKLGGTVLSEPTDMPWVRTTTIRDPQGATFVASQFVPENTDLALG
jgi:predicted enzyme related to lactoylglutathione lyase